MEEYRGKKDADYFYNLAVIYEAAAAKNENTEDLERAYDNYATAMQLSGGNDAMITKAQARFDAYYRLFEKVVEQRRANTKLEKKLQKEYGVTY